jgi:hypothetical protein
MNFTFLNQKLPEYNIRQPGFLSEAADESM